MKRILVLLAVSTGAVFAQAPVISGILNNYGLINSGSVAQGAIFIVKGSNLSVQTTGLQNVPLQTTLQGVQIKITVAGTTTIAPLYYVLPQQLAGILPSTTPTGAGTLVAVNNGQSSAPAAITVVKSAFGMLALNGAGTGGAAVYDTNYSLLSNTNATNPGNAVTFWGSGVGPTPAPDETVSQTGANASGDLTNIPITVQIGGANAQVLYRGRSAYPGLDQINVVIPTLASTAYSCTVTVLITTNGVQANALTIPVAPSGSACTNPPVSGGGNTSPDPTPAEVSAWATAGRYTVGGLSLLRSTGYSVRDVSGGTTTNITKFDGFTGSFNRLSGPGLATALTAPPQLVPKAGVCTVVTSLTIPTYSIAPLNAGPSVSVNGPNGTQIATLLQPGLYNATVPNTYMAQGRYLFTGTGGTDVGAFTGTLDVSPELVWTNTDAAKVITRANDLTIQWTGGDPTQLVTIHGTSTISTTNFAAFYCWANNSAGQFTIPANILSQLPASPVIGTTVSRGTLVLYSYFATRLTAPGVDLFTASGEWSVTVTAQYK